MIWGDTYTHTIIIYYSYYRNPTFYSAGTRTLCGSVFFEGRGGGGGSWCLWDLSASVELLKMLSGI